MLNVRRILASRLRIVGLIDIDTMRAAAALDSKLKSDQRAAWSSCKVFPSVAEASRALDPGLVPQYVPSPHQYLSLS